MTAGLFTGARKARIGARIILSLGLLCLVGVLFAQNLHNVIHEVMHLDDRSGMQVHHSHPAALDSDAAVAASGSRVVVEIVRQCAGVGRVLTDPIYLPTFSPPPRTI